MNFDEKKGDYTEISLDFPLHESSYHSDVNLLQTDYASNFEDKEGYGIPLSAFRSEMSAFQIVVKYLHEVEGLSFKELASMLDRAYTSIYNTYRGVRHSALDLAHSALKVPVSIFSSGLSPLEALVQYLHSTGLRYSEIALQLGKDQRTIWTVHNRAKAKLHTAEDYHG